MQPASASTLAAKVGLSRQKVNYHLHALEHQIQEGDSVRLTPQGLEPIEGVIDYLRPNFIGLRTSDALYCCFGRNAFGAPVAMSIHLFRDEVDAGGTERIWQNWLATALV